MVKVFAAVFQIKEAKIIVIEDTGHKCTSSNPTRESENLWGLLDFLLFQGWNVFNYLLNISGHKGVGIRGGLLSCKFCVELHGHYNISSVKVTKC